MIESWRALSCNYFAANWDDFWNERVQIFFCEAFFNFLQLWKKGKSNNPGIFTIINLTFSLLLNNITALHNQCYVLKKHIVSHLSWREKPGTVWLTEFKMALTFHVSQPPRTAHIYSTNSNITESFFPADTSPTPTNKQYKNIYLQLFFAFFYKLICIYRFRPFPESTYIVVSS